MRDERLRELRAAIPTYSALSIALLDTELRIVWVNATFARFYENAEEFVGRPITDMFPDRRAGGVESILRQALETGEQVADIERRGPFPDEDRWDRVWGVTAFQIRDESGAVAGAALVASDATERSRDRERLAVLNEASSRIGSTLEIARTAEETLDVLIPRVADCGHVNLLSHLLDGEPYRLVGAGGEDPRMRIVANRWLPGRPVPEAIATGSVFYLDAASLYFRWLSQGRTIFEPDLSAPSAEFEEMNRRDFFVRRFRTLRGAGIHSGMIVPIAARGMILGTVALFRNRDPAITEQEVSLAEEVLARSAICLDNARVYSRERATALELQRSMLPQSIAEAPGLDFAYRYEPANTASEIGGDWFDVVHQPDGRIALVVGDVAGHDMHAASIMGRLRTVTRTLASLDLSPVEVLTRLDAVVAEMGPEEGATCVYAAFEPETGRCVIARAGHPQPALVGVGGGVEFLDLPPGLPLGVGGAEFESVELGLERGSILVLYTDGLIESREAAIDIGMDNLARALAAGHEEPFGPSYASALINRLVADPADDIAVLVARIAQAAG